MISLLSEGLSRVFSSTTLKASWGAGKEGPGDHPEPALDSDKAPLAASSMRWKVLENPLQPAEAQPPEALLLSSRPPLPRTLVMGVSEGIREVTTREVGGDPR